MLQGVGQGGRTVPRDHVDPLRHRRRQAAVLDLLDDQRADGRLGRPRRFSGSSSSPMRGRCSGSTATVFECDSSMYSWMASSTCGAMSCVSPVYQIGFARGHHRRGQPGQQADGVGTLVENVLAADRLDDALVALANGHADAVALDQPPPFVGDRVGRLERLERGVDRAGEILQPRPKDLAVGEMPQLMALEKVGGQFAHLQQEPQIAALASLRRCRSAGRPRPRPPSPGRSARAPAPGGNRSGWPPARRLRCRNAAGPTSLRWTVRALHSRRPWRAWASSSSRRLVCWRLIWYCRANGCLR